MKQNETNHFTNYIREEEVKELQHPCQKKSESRNLLPNEVSRESPENRVFDRRLLSILFFRTLSVLIHPGLHLSTLSLNLANFSLRGFKILGSSKNREQEKLLKRRERKRKLKGKDVCKINLKLLFCFTSFLHCFPLLFNVGESPSHCTFILSV